MPDNSAPSPDSSVRVYVDGQVHADWSSYDIDSDLLTPADAWHVSLSVRDLVMPAAIRPGVPVAIRVGDDLVMTGRIDEVGREISKDGWHVSMSGRDKAAALLDCACPLFTAKQVTLKEIIAKAVIPLGIGQPTIYADKSFLREKIAVEPGQKAWEVLTLAAEANGLWPWLEPDGTLIIGGPNYDTPPVATLILKKDAPRDNNVLSLSYRRSIQGRYSEVTVLGQGHGTIAEAGKHAIKATEKDTGVDWFRPLIVVDHECDNEAQCRRRAKKLLADSRLKGFTLTAMVSGHRIVAPGQASHNLLWQPGQRVNVVTEQGETVYFLMARKFTGGRQQAARTHLTLKEDRTWVLEAHAHKKSRLKADAAPIQILDVAKGAAQ